MHFSNFFRYMEAAEHAFFDSLGLRLHRNGEEGGMSGWARVHADCDYARPVHYRDRLRVKLQVRAMTSSTIRYDFAFDCRPADAEPASPADGWANDIARGCLTVAYVGRDSRDERMRARRMPPEVVSAIQIAPPELLQDEKGQ